MIEESTDGSKSFAGSLSPVIQQIFRFCQITVREYLDDRLFLRSMALTFVTLLAIVPVLAISFSMFRMFGGGEWFMETIKPTLMLNLAPGSWPVLAERIQSLVHTGSSKTIGGIGLVFLVIVVYGIFSAIESTFNLIWGVTSRSGTLHRLSIYWGLVTIIPLLMASSLALTTYLRALPLVSQAVERVGFSENLLNRMLPSIMVFLSLYLLYKYIPSTRVRTKSALLGAGVALILYEITKYFFILYTGKLVKYDVIYGSLAAIPLLMVWVNLSWIMVLTGVEVSFVSQHFNLLMSRRKHMEFSRHQLDALAYLILTQVTLAFRGKRDRVTIDEWSHKYGIPPAVIHELVGKFSKGGILQIIGSDRSELLLVRDPEYVTVGSVNKILSGEAIEEWSWPDDTSWEWMKNWIRFNDDLREHTADGKTLDDVVSSIEQVINAEDIRAQSK